MAYAPQPTEGDDTIQGDTAHDVIDALGGHDIVLGLGGDDLLIGGAGSDDLQGGDGNDTFDGGLGWDLLSGGLGSNLVRFFQGDETDTYVAPPPDTAGHEVVIDLSGYFSRVPGDIRTGLTVDDITIFRGGAELVFAVKGSEDELRLQDYYSSEHPGVYPQVRVLLAGGIVLDNDDIARLLLSVDGTDGPDVLQGDARDNMLRGWNGDDLLDGGAGNDFLDGQFGADTMRGGTGDDMMVVDDPGDRVVEKPRGGIDTVQSYIDYTLGNNVENLILIGGLDSAGTGNRLDNVLTGTETANVLRGLQGDDVLWGLGGNDVLDGGAGIDTVDGGAGNDTVVMNDVKDVLDGGDDLDTLLIGAGLRKIDLTGLGGDTVRSFETISLDNGMRNELTLTAADVRAISPIGRMMRIDGEAGDTLRIDATGWSRVAVGPGGVDLYVHGSGDTMAVLLIAQDMTICMCQ